MQIRYIQAKELITEIRLSFKSYKKSLLFLFYNKHIKKYIYYNNK